MKHTNEIELYPLRLADGDHPAVIVVKEVIESTPQRLRKLHFGADGTLKYVEPGTLTEEATRTTHFYADLRPAPDEEITRRSVELAFELAESTSTGSPSRAGRG